MNRRMSAELARDARVRDLHNLLGQAERLVVKAQVLCEQLTRVDPEGASTFRDKSKSLRMAMTFLGQVRDFGLFDGLEDSDLLSEARALVSWVESRQRSGVRSLRASLRGSQYQAALKQAGSLLSGLKASEEETEQVAAPARRASTEPKRTWRGEDYGDL